MQERATSQLLKADFSKRGLAFPERMSPAEKNRFSDSQVIGLFWRALAAKIDKSSSVLVDQQKQPTESTGIFDSAKLASINQNYDISVLVAKADEARRNEVLLILEKVSHILIASGSISKINAVTDFVKIMTGVVNGSIKTSVCPLTVEPSSDKVVDVAGHKAAWAHDTVVQRLTPEMRAVVDQTGQWLDWQRLLSREPVKNSLELGTLAIGADVNFFRKEADGAWRQGFKLDRLGRDLTEVEEIGLHDRLKQLYCFSAEKTVEVMWPIAAVWVSPENSQAFWNLLKIVSKSIDPELFEVYWQMAKKDGKIYSTNPHFGLIECLKSQGQIISMGILSNEESKLGLTLEQKMIAPTPSKLKTVESGIVANNLVRSR